MMMHGLGNFEKLLKMYIGDDDGREDARNTLSCT
jgi:hypothetical protein